GKELESPDDLPRSLERAPVAVTFWREGERHDGRLGGLPLGATLDPRSARAAVRAWRRQNEALAQRGAGHKRLPGTLAEVEAIAALVEKSRKLTGSDASEQKLDELREKGELKKYRLIHLATHGSIDGEDPRRSALILAQDRLPDPARQALEGKRVYDGRL